MSIPRLAIINVVYENYTVLQDFIESLRMQKNQCFKLFNIDVSKNRKKINTDGFTSETIFSDNLGYANGVNIGLKNAINQDFQYFCIVNNDIYFENNFTGKCLDSLLAHPTSVISGEIYYAPGYEYHKDRYVKKDLGRVIWYAGGYFDWDHVLTPHLGVNEIDNGQYDLSKQTEFVSGALMIFDKPVIDKVGYWDESYFLYYEDADFRIRAKKADIKFFYDSSVVVWHKVSQSTGGSGSKLHQKYQNKNRLKFGLKYAPLKTKLHLIKNFVLG